MHSIAGAKLFNVVAFIKGNLNLLCICFWRPGNRHRRNDTRTWMKETQEKEEPFIQGVKNGL